MDSHIKSSILAALAYIHLIPTGLFNLHLVVPDQDLQRACTEIVQPLQYNLCSPIPDRYVKLSFFFFLNASQPRTFPVLLELTAPHKKRHTDDSEMVYIHPQSQVYLDNSRSVFLPHFPDTIQFPTRTAFLDSMIELDLDPPSSRMHTRRDTLLSSWISHLLNYTPRNGPRVLPNGDLGRERVEVVRSRKPEYMYILELATGYYLEKVVRRY